MRLLFLVASILFVAVHAQESSEKNKVADISFDPREEWGFCFAFIPEDQGTCNACVAAALASSLGLRLCIQHRINLRFSSQQIWDCYSGVCQEGVHMNEFIFSLIHSPKNHLFLSPRPTETNHSIIIKPSNSSACRSSIDTPTNNSYIITGVSEHMEHWMENSVSDPFNQSTYSIRLMQTEILEKGPILAVLYLTHAEMIAFSQWNEKTSEQIFTPVENALNQVRDNKHAVTIFGWGVDTKTKKLYWKILNSFGSKWGENGIGNIPGGFGLVGREWYSVFASSLPCAMQDNGCIKEPAPIMIDWVGKINHYKVSASNHSSDTMFQSAEDKRWTLGVVMTKESRPSGTNDGIILIGVIFCMAAISTIICSTNQRGKNTQRLYLPLRA
jgi:hypothetical protein